jgi:hypothetical protein
VNDQSSASPEGDVELFIGGIVKRFGIDVWKVPTMSLRAGRSSCPVPFLHVRINHEN